MFFCWLPSNRLASKNTCHGICFLIDHFSSGRWSFCFDCQTSVYICLAQKHMSWDLFSHRQFFSIGRWRKRLKDEQSLRNCRSLTTQTSWSNGLNSWTQSPRAAGTRRQSQPENTSEDWISKQNARNILVPSLVASRFVSLGNSAPTRNGGFSPRSSRRASTSFQMQSNCLWDSTLSKATRHWAQRNCRSVWRLRKRCRDSTFQRLFLRTET